MLLAEKWQMPRVFEPGGRHAAMLAGLTGEERRARVGRIAKGLGHWAIPQDEALHLSATVHSSLMIGGMKCSGEKGKCAHCLKNGMRTEETAAHVHYKCPKAKAVWQVVMADWNEKTGDQLSPADLTAAVAGLRTCPPGVTGEAMAEWEASEPAWRLLCTQSRSTRFTGRGAARTRRTMPAHRPAQRLLARGTSCVGSSCGCSSASNTSTRRGEVREAAQPRGRADGGIPATLGHTRGGGVH